MAQPYTVTAGTSIVLISTLQSPNTVVLLSSLQYPGHIVGIRDITGSNSITQTPVIISTMSSLKFYDGTSSILLNTPNGFVSLASRDARTWQLLNSVGFLTTLSTGFLETLTSDRAFVTTTSTIQEFTSSLVAANVTVTKSIEVLGNTNIEGNISIAGSFDVFSTLRAYQNVSLSSGLIVKGNVSFPSSLFIKDNVSVGSNLSTSQNLIVGEDLWIHQNLYGSGALLPPFVSVQTLTVDTLTVGGGVQIGGGLSTLNMSVSSNVFVAGKGTFENSLFVSGMTAVQSTLTFDSQLTTSSFQVTNASAAFAGDIRVSTLAVFGGLSTLESFSAPNHASFQAETLVYGPVSVKSTTFVQNLTVLSSVYMSSLVVSSFQTNGFVSSYGSTLVVERSFTGLSTFAIGRDLIAGGRGTPYTYSFFSTGFDVGTLNVEENLTINKRLNVKGDSFIGGNMDGITSITALQNISTGYLNVGGSITFLGNLDVNQVASASTLGAPIRFDISTLSLSNTMTVNSFASIPSFTVNELPAKLAAGQSLENRGGNDIFVDGVLQNRSTVNQVGDPMKLWYANSLRTSTLSGLPNLSSVVLGNTNFTYPVGSPYRGILVGGQLNGGGNLIAFGSNVSSIFNSCEGAILAGFTPRRIRYNGSLWVAVGSGGTGFAYSQDGYTWSPGTGFSMSMVNDVAFGGGKWVATGVNPGSPTIAYSVNGISWTAATNPFATPGFGNGVAFNGTNQWLAVGRSPSGVAQAKYSSDGITWQNSVISLLYSEVEFTCVVWDNANWNVFTNFTSGNSWVYQSGNGITFNLAVGVQQAVLYGAYGGTDPDFSGSSYVLVGSNLGGNLATTVSRGAFLPTRTFVGMFTLQGTDVFYDSNTSSWLVAGFNTLANGPSFGYSSNLTTWFSVSAFPGSNRTIATGTLQTPQFDQYFTANLTSIFHSTLSSQQMTVSTLNVSSVQGTFFGDGSRLTNISQYSSTLNVSSITARQIRTQDISASLVQFLTTTVNNSVKVPFKTFPSSGNLFLAAGNDNTARGSIQTSPDGSTWSRSLTSNFEFYGNDITGNGDLENPLYVAVGADSRPNHTIQYSRDGIVWNPVVTGGFEYATEEGICEGTSVAYGRTNTNVPMWVATGVYIGSTATTQYSLDGLNWSNLNNGFEDFGTKVKGSPYASPTSGFLASGKNAMKYILSPPTWNDVTITLFGLPIVTNMTAFAPGRLSGNIDSWLAVDEQNRVYGTPSKIPAIFSGGSATTVGPVNDLIWRGNTDWTGVGSNIVQTSVGGFTWTQQLQFNQFVTNTNSIVFNSTLMRYVLGATSVIPQYTLWTSPDGTANWEGVVGGGGFSTAVENYGQGYGIVSLGTSTFAVGNSALSLETRVRPAILKLFSTANSSLVTEISLTASNASNLFINEVRGIGATDSEIYKYIAVGDSTIPQKTIARSIDGSQGSWIPAITGGFNDTGYGVTYFRDKWIAVGDALSSRNTIQYSPDGANWFGTNSANGIRLGGRGVAAGISTLSSVAVAVGIDSGIYSLVFSRDGFNWSTTTGCNFDVQGNGVACGKDDIGDLFVAVGQDTRASSNTILRSGDGISWSCMSTGTYFSDGGFGVAYGNNKWVAVGEDTTGNTILHSGNGGIWLPATNGFTFGGYGVSYSDGFSSFFAVGKDTNGDSQLTVKYSPNGASWTNFSTTTGFISQKAVGSANGVMTQGIFSFESVPYMNFSNLVVYDRESPLLYPVPGIRVSTNYIGFSEGMYVNLSSQVSFGSNSNYPGAAVTVSPYPVFVSSILYYGSTFVSSVSQFSTITVSSIQTNFETLLSCPLETPAFAFNVPSTAGATPFSQDVFPRYEFGRANFLSPEIPFTIDPAYTFHVNRALQVNAIRGNLVANTILRNNVVIGQQPSDTNYTIENESFPEALVYGNFAASTFSTNVLYAPCNVYVSASRVYFRDDYLSMFEGTNPSLVPIGNRIQTEPSSMTFNSLMTLQVSTQKVGVYTRNPQFELDVQRNAVLSGIQANEVNTSVLFLTLQTLNN